MACIIPVNGVHPQLPAFLAPNASLIGDVRCGSGCSVWFGVVLRADINHICLGDRCNIQDNSVLHVSAALACTIGADTSVGHQATVHACSVGERCLIGMQSVLLDGVEVGDDCVIAAGAVLREGMRVPPGHIVAGVPARIIKAVSASLRQRIQRIADDYQACQALYPAICREIADDAAREGL